MKNASLNVIGLSKADSLKIHFQCDLSQAYRQYKKSKQLPFMFWTRVASGVRELEATDKKYERVYQDEI